MPSQLPIHFFTIVLNGEPFIRYHLARMQALTCDWHWHIIEGLAELKHDTAWSLPYGAKLPTDTVKDGRSIDGTAEYLDQIARENPDRITLYRAPNGRNWDGKLEMITAPMSSIPDDSLLWEVDSDELWTTEQFEHLRQLFLENPERTAAVFFCWYFVGPTLAINRKRSYPEIQWRRAWRFRKGMRWMAHEPPVLAVPIAGTEQWEDVAQRWPITPQEAEQQGLVFQHYAYVIETQLAFKETYYGYKGITEQWRRLQTHQPFPVPLRNYMNWPWVDPGAMVDPPETCGIIPLARLVEGQWIFQPTRGALPKPGRDFKLRRQGAIIFHRGIQNALAERAIRSVRILHPGLPIHVERIADDAAIDKRLLLQRSPYDETLVLDADTVVLDRLEFGFDMAKRHGVACCIAECPWARRDGTVQGDLVEYNAGVLFFTAKAVPIFDAWAALDASAGSIRLFDPRTQRLAFSAADHTRFSLAVAQSATPPFILPANWNFRPQWQKTWWGPIKIWHDANDPPPGLVTFTHSQAQPDAIIQYISL